LAVNVAINVFSLTSFNRIFFYAINSPLPLVVKPGISAALQKGYFGRVVAQLTPRLVSVGKKPVAAAPKVVTLTPKRVNVRKNVVTVHPKRFS